MHQMKKLSVIKIGGNIIDHPAKLAKFLTDFAQLKGYKILVHGGGKIATEIGASLGIEANMVDGRRITDAATLKVVTMVYAGLINKNVVANLQALKCNAIGLTGADVNAIQATKRNPEPVDYGFVGDVNPADIKTATLQLFLENDIIPIFAPLTHDGKGQLLNTNADTIASSLAVALSALYDTTLLYCFEKQGVLKDINDETSVIHEISSKRYETLKDEGIIFHGMIPKIDNAFKAIQEGVKSVYICHADQLLDIINKGEKRGTELFK
jgi:acetylglutamate kinase